MARLYLNVRVKPCSVGRSCRSGKSNTTSSPIVKPPIFRCVFHSNSAVLALFLVRITWLPHTHYNIGMDSVFVFDICHSYYMIHYRPYAAWLRFLYTTQTMHKNEVRFTYAWTSPHTTRSAWSSSTTEYMSSASFTFDMICINSKSYAVFKEEFEVTKSLLIILQGSLSIVYNHVNYMLLISIEQIRMTEVVYSII